MIDPISPLLKSNISGLPPEPARAIVVFADRVIENVLNKNPRPGKSEDYAAILSFCLRFCAKYKVPIELPDKGPNVFEHMSQVIGTIKSQRAKILTDAVDAEVDSLLVECDSGIGETFGIAKLNADEKKKIHDYINKIRSLIEGSDLSDRKKNALFDRLNELSSEVDAHGTATDRFFGFVSDLGFVMGEFGKNAKPLFAEVRGMIQAVSRARARQEGISLPPGDEPLRLPAPDGEE